MIIYFVLFFSLIFNVINCTTYTCDRRATCGCSKRPTVTLSRIIGGEPNNVPDSWGWMASLRRDGLHQCGASLITPSHVITAAHCIHDVTVLSRFSLHFGITNLSDIGLSRTITKVYVHPLYQKESYVNDLAILRLNTPIDLLKSNLACICLPTSSEFNLQVAEYPPIDAKLVAIGWGTTEPFVPIPSPVLQQITLMAIARTDSSCLHSIYDDVVQFCAGSRQDGKDTCKGDSGGPLMLYKNGRWQLTGITSYGEVCGSANFAGVYTRIAYFESYIKQILNSDGVKISYSKELQQEEEEKHPRSNARIFYKISMFQFLLSCLLFIH